MSATGRILLVEDEEADVMLMKLAFAEAGLSAAAQIVSDGREALRYLRGEGQYADREKYFLPTMVLLDLRLPYVPGLEVLKAIRADTRLSRLIVVVLTSSALEQDVKRAYDLGANSYVTKPCLGSERQQLVNLLREYWMGKNIAPPLG